MSTTTQDFWGPNSKFKSQQVCKLQYINIGINQSFGQTEIMTMKAKQMLFYVQIFKQIYP